MIYRNVNGRMQSFKKRVAPFLLPPPLHAFTPMAMPMQSQARSEASIEVEGWNCQFLSLIRLDDLELHEFQLFASGHHPFLYEHIQLEVTICLPSQWITSQWSGSHPPELAIDVLIASCNHFAISIDLSPLDRKEGWIAISILKLHYFKLNLWTLSHT